jgi:hypothetical protein
MNIEDVKCGDRCWVAFGNIENDFYGQNATVISLKTPGSIPGKFAPEIMVQGDNGNTWVCVPSHTVFWAQPLIPNKPKRELSRCMSCHINREDANSLLLGKIKTGLLWRGISDDETHVQVMVSWEENE